MGENAGSFSLNPRGSYRHTWEYRTRKVKRFFVTKILPIVVAMILMAGWSFNKDKVLSPEVVYHAEAEVATSTPPVPKENPSAVLQRIAKCESGGKHYDSKGRLIKNINKNGSVDYGMYQINDKSWEIKAAELGFDIYSPEGNEAMAFWIYENRGTEDWKYSKHCWLK